MKKVVLLLGCALAFALGARAQEGDNVQVGVFADYFRSHQTSTNFAGLGARLGIGAKHVKLEAEVSYDFNQVFTEGFRDTTTGSVTFQRTNEHVLHGLVGPKLDLGHSAFHPFVELKGGFVNYSFSARPATFDTFVSTVDNLRSSNISGVLMPGGGLEGKLGPVGLRLDVGDEMYFNHGAHHNLKVMFGPFIRF